MIVYIIHVHVQYNMYNVLCHNDICKLRDVSWSGHNNFLFLWKRHRDFKSFVLTLACQVIINPLIHQKYGDIHPSEPWNKRPWSLYLGCDLWTHDPHNQPWCDLYCNLLRYCKMYNSVSISYVNLILSRNMIKTLPWLHTLNLTIMFPEVYILLNWFPNYIYTGTFCVMNRKPV